MSNSMEERLRLVVDADTQAGTSGFDKLSRSATDSANSAKSAGSEVAAAADRVAQARLKEQDAAGKLAVAEVRLQELRDNGAKASAIAAAEERVASAQRSVQAATGATTRAVEQQNDVRRRAVEEIDRNVESAGRLRGALGGLAVGAGAVVGAGLTDWLRDSVAGFLEGARGANALATSMNATVEQAGQLGQLMGSVGLEADDLLEIQAEFAQKVAASDDALSSFGAELQKNDDGTINWALSLEDALVNLQQIPDATERNRVGFQLFGEEGYKQLSRLLNSGMSVADALEQIGTPFSEADVRAAQEYDQAMSRLKLAATGAGQSLGRELVPLLTDALTAFGQVVTIVTAIPAPLGLATAAAIALGVTGFTPASLAGGRLATVLATIRAEMGPVAAGMIGGGAAAGVLGAGMSGAAVAGRGLATMLGGPLGLALLAGGAAWAVAQAQQRGFDDAVADGAKTLAQAEGQYDDMAVSAQKLGKRLADERSAWENLAAARRGAQEQAEEDGGFWGWLQGLTPGYANSLGNYNEVMGDGELAAKGYAAGIDEAKEAMGAFDTQQQVAADAATRLNNLIAEGDTSGQAFAEAVRDSAEAQRDQSATTDTATAALAAYEAVTRGAFQATLDLLGAQLQQSDGLIAVQKAIADTAGVVDDPATAWNELDEVVNRVIGSTLSYAGAAADAAVAAAKAAGQPVDALAEAQIRADAVIAALRTSLDQKDLTAGAQAQIQAMIDQLQTAKDKGDIQAVLSLTGVPEAESQLATV
ncbi:MAG: hypothetical protein JWP57_4557, partial [Spirosoma sp.]|nr:hypothetical protein [Spirosoma sp.]